MACQQCVETKPNGERCRNRVCMGVPYCWIHRKKKYNLIVKPSTIPGAGKGLFAVDAIPSQSWICPYYGQHLSMNCIDYRYGEETAPYTASFGRINVDSACKRGVGAMANGLFRLDGFSRSINQHNCSIEYKLRGYGGTNSQGLWLFAFRDIPAGGELFCYYGEDYNLFDQNHVTKRTSRQDNRPC